MITKFNLIGLAKHLQKFTIETLKTKDIFWMYEAESPLSKEQYDSLFHLASHTPNVWKGDNYVLIEHDGFYEDEETPKNAKIIKVILQI